MRAANQCAIAGLLFLVSGCGGGGGDHRDVVRFPVTVTEVPDEYRGATCTPAALTNASQVVMSCSSPERSCLFVRWEGGDRFTEIPSPQTTGQCGIFQYGENGSYIGTTLEERPAGDVTEVNIGTVVFDGHAFLEHAEGVAISQLSRSGRFGVGYILNGVPEPRLVLFENFRPHPITSSTRDVELVDGTAVNDSGNVAGSAVVGQSANSFAAQVAYRLRGSQLELLSPLGRPELNSVFALGINNRGDVIGLSTTDTVIISSPEPASLSADYRISRAVLYTSDGRVRNVGPGDPFVNTIPSGVNNNGIVYGFFATFDGAHVDGQGYFVFSEKSGFVPLSEVLPDDVRDRDLSVSALNDRNELLLTSLAGSSPVLVRLPADF